MNSKENNKVRIALFASGAGSNVLNIINHFKSSEAIEVALVLSNNKSAGALIHAQKAKIEAMTFSRQEFFEANAVLRLLITEKINYIILAGFLWKIPKNLLSNFNSRIINIHPSLLPKYGGKGMYGAFVHEAVLANKEKETGITIHLVNELYDDGKIIKQVKCKIEDKETLPTLQKKISTLEKRHFPSTIENYINKK